MRNVLIISAHPDTGSFSNGLTAALYGGLEQNPAVDVRLLTIAECDFDPILHRGYRGDQPLEPDLKAAQEMITWAHDTIWIYPTWWGNMPALLKGFIDRTFLPGFAFRFNRFGFPSKLLSGRTATIITTMDSPPILMQSLLMDLSVRVLKSAVLNFCGLKVKKTLRLGSVKKASPKKRQRWLITMEELGLTWG